MKKIILLLIFISGVCFAQEKENVIPDSKIEQSLERIDFRLEKLEGFQGNLDGKLSNHTQDVNNRIDGMENQWIWGVISVVGTVGVFLVVLFGGYNRIKDSVHDFAKEKLEEEVETIRLELQQDYRQKLRKEFHDLFEKEFHAKKDEILGLIRAHERVHSYKMTKKILILCERTEDIKKNDRLFREVLEFSKAKAILFKDYQNSPENADLIIFDREEYSREATDTVEYLVNDAIAKVITDSKDESLFLYFGGQNGKMRPFTGKINFANSRFTLAPRIIESLEYRHLIEKNGEA